MLILKTKDDTIRGGPGPDTIRGNAGFDVIYGEENIDTVLAIAFGEDTLIYVTELD